MAIRTVVTRGFGNGTFNGTITDVTLRGFAIQEIIVTDAINFFFSRAPIIPKNDRFNANLKR